MKLEDIIDDLHIDFKHENHLSIRTSVYVQNEVKFPESTYVFGNLSTYTTNYYLIQEALIQIKLHAYINNNSIKLLPGSYVGGIVYTVGESLDKKSYFHCDLRVDGYITWSGLLS